jgi:hypothetical protein
MSTRHRRSPPPLAPYKAAEMLGPVEEFQRQVRGWMADVPREDRAYVVFGILSQPLLTAGDILRDDDWKMHLRFGDAGSAPAGKPRV